MMTYVIDKSGRSTVMSRLGVTLFHIVWCCVLTDAIALMSFLSLPVSYSHLITPSLAYIHPRQTLNNHHQPSSCLPEQIVKAITTPPLEAPIPVVAVATTTPTTMGLTITPMTMAAPTATLVAEAPPIPLPADIPVPLPPANDERMALCATWTISSCEFSKVC
mmetsp:Transcript_40685/g.71505  ORF Transcript_40685/g.71505 Transcript_40685/m.71505 type:complete len:163 (+) Transcript_40685:218-706(+)